MRYAVLISLYFFQKKVVKGNSVKVRRSMCGIRLKKPIPVPEVIPLTTEQEKLYEGAGRRRELRLILGNRIPAKDAKLLKEYLLSQ